MYHSERLRPEPWGQRPVDETTVDVRGGRHYLIAVRPPSTTRLWPVMKEEASEMRNPTASATSQGLPARPRSTELASGLLPRISSVECCNGVSIHPGTTRFARTAGAPSAATARQRANWACFEASYAGIPV